MTFDRFVASLLFVGIAMLACLMPAQNDTWWHLRAGQEMIASGRVLLTDTFSHTVYGAHWPNYEWLGDVIFAASHRIGGMPVLTALCAAAVTGGLLFLFAAMGGSRGGLTPVLLMTGVVAGATITWSVRPQAFSLFMLGLTIWLIVRRKWMLLPVVFLVWANVHGAVAWGGVLLAGTAAGYVWHERRVPVLVLVSAALAALATLLTPLGLWYWWEIVQSVQRSKTNDIAEWHAPALPPDHLVFWAAAAALPVLVVLGHRRLRYPEERGLVVSALLLLPLAVMTMRNITPFLMVASAAMTFLVSREQQQPTRPDRRANGPGRSTLHVVLVAGAAAAAASVVVGAWRAGAPRLGWHPMSEAAARSIEACRGPLYNRYPDGGPIIFFAPSQKVLIDSRQDPYPGDLFEEQHQVESTGDYERAFARYGINCAALPPESLTAMRLQADGWALRYHDRQWVVLERPSP
jgi:hypothetical protein